MEYPDFKNKILSISSSEDTYNYDFMDPHFEKIADRIFIVGTIPRESTKSGWNANKVGAIAWDCVTDYIIFDSYEDYKTATEVAEKYEDEDDK